MADLKKTEELAPKERIAAKGLMYQDSKAITACQRKCAKRLGMTIQLEQQAYMTQHPEVPAMMKKFIAQMASLNLVSKKKDAMKYASYYFTRPFAQIDEDVRQFLGLPAEGPYVRSDKSSKPSYYDDNLENDLKSIITQHYPPEEWTISEPSVASPDTLSSPFLSIITSGTTLPTPEPLPTPELTDSEFLFSFLSYAVDKACYVNIQEEDILYDTAYVELMHAVEDAMEIPVIDIKDDIAELFFRAYKKFEDRIIAREQIAASKAWENRMRKKLKRTLRMQKNFKGYETPPSTKSCGSHASWKVPPQKPCICHPQFKFNRYEKDRFGIYLPRDAQFSDLNTTVTPAISEADVSEGGRTVSATSSLASAKKRSAHSRLRMLNTSRTQTV